MRRAYFAAGVLVLVVAAYAGARALEHGITGRIGVASDERGARVMRYVLHSRLLRRDLHELAVVPAGGGRRSLLVLLHGRGMHTDSLLSSRFFAALASLGRRAPAVVVVDGGDHSYYHDRRDGPWGSYVLREAIPDAIRRLGADGRRVAIGGFSMGGFGALDLALRAPRRFCAVGGHSAALWERGGDTPGGAFDDAADFARNDVLGAARRGARFGHGPVWLDVGTADPFLRTDRELARLVHARFRSWPGGHAVSYWTAHMRAYLGFYADALAACRDPDRHVERSR